MAHRDDVLRAALELLRDLRRYVDDNDGDRWGFDQDIAVVAAAFDGASLVTDGHGRLQGQVVRLEPSEPVFDGAPIDWSFYRATPTTEERPEWGELLRRQGLGDEAKVTEAVPAGATLTFTPNEWARYAAELDRLRRVHDAAEDAWSALDAIGQSEAADRLRAALDS